MAPSTLPPPQQKTVFEQLSKSGPKVFQHNRVKYVRFPVIKEQQRKGKGREGIKVFQTDYKSGSLPLPCGALLGPFECSE